MYHCGANKNKIRYQLPEIQRVEGCLERRRCTTMYIRLSRIPLRELLMFLRLGFQFYDQCPLFHYNFKCSFWWHVWQFITLLDWHGTMINYLIYMIMKIILIMKRKIMLQMKVSMLVLVVLLTGRFK